MHAPRLVWIPILLTTVLLVLAACTSDPTPTPAPRATETPQPTAPPEPTATPQPAATSRPTATPAPIAEPTEAPATGTGVSVIEHPTLGNVLADREGRVLYLFLNDERLKSACEGGCLNAWPPLATDGAPQAGDGVDADRLSTTTGNDGSTQVTYNGWPLYYFANDDAAGDANGQDRADVWYVVSPFGGPVFTSALIAMSNEGTNGPHIVDGSGRVKYLYTRDEKNVTTCSGRCALAWPPLLTIEAPAVGEGLAEDRVGVIDREDGGKQVTYNGWPLYYYAADEKPGDTLGLDSRDVWYLVSPDGGPVRTAAAVNLATGTKFGDILADDSGRTLYLYTRDEAGVSNCAGGCARAWPPLLTVDAPSVGGGLDAALLGVASRGDGAKQVTYNGWPLYYFANDEKPGDTNGQESRDVWFVVTAAGEQTTEEVVQPIASSIRNFTLENLTFTVGQTVIWTNRDTVVHTATSDTPGIFDTGNLSQGDSGSYTFTEVGTFSYFCEIHPSMTATITVTQ